MARLPALRDLDVGMWDFSPILALDLRAVHVPLSRLVLSGLNHDQASHEVAHFSPTTAASLRVLALPSNYGYVARPPMCVRGAGGALTALTRLEYGLKGCTGWQPAAFDLAAWGNAAEYGLPALRVLIVHSGAGFAVDVRGGRVGPSGRAGVATLPRLEHLTLAKRWYGTYRAPPLFACRSRYSHEPAPCEHCWQAAACAGAAAVEELIMRGLPADGVAAGRRLAVVSGVRVAAEWNRNQDFSFGRMVYVPVPQ